MPKLHNISMLCLYFPFLNLQAVFKYQSAAVAIFHFATMDGKTLGLFFMVIVISADMGEL